MKANYDGKRFDSELEVEYYKYLNILYAEKEIWDFAYHPKQPIKLVDGSTYTPDFIVFYNDRVEIIETKGYSQFSALKDGLIHKLMLSKTEDELRGWLLENDIIWTGKIIYRKIKYLQKFGWVDFNFKNPNTIANQRKEKIEELEQENKELRMFKREAIRYIAYLKKPKLTKRQLEFKEGFEEKLQEEM